MSDQRPATEIMDCGHFLTLCAKDRAVATFGHQIKSWPAENWWAVVSSYKSAIREEEIPHLMQRYGVRKLTSCERYVTAPAEDSIDGKSV